MQMPKLITIDGRKLYGLNPAYFVAAVRDLVDQDYIERLYTEYRSDPSEAKRIEAKNALLFLDASNRAMYDAATNTELELTKAQKSEFNTGKKHQRSDVLNHAPVRGVDFESTESPAHLTLGEAFDLVKARKKNYRVHKRKLIDEPMMNTEPKAKSVKRYTEEELAQFAKERGLEVSTQKKVGKKTS